MPITEKGSIYYSMPHNIKKLMDYEFCETFMKELHNVWGFSLNDFNWESIGYSEGTGGWYESFAATCRILNKGELLLYYNNLSWYDSDLFDAELSELLVTYKLILPTIETDEIARQLDIDENKIKHCFVCNGDYIKEDVVKLDKNDEDYDEYTSNYICKDCEKLRKKQNIKEKELSLKEDVLSHRLSYNILKAIQEVLGLNENEYFYCESCGKYHFNFNKGKEHCHHCEINAISENKNANVHYKENIILNEKFLYSLKPKKFTYEDYIFYVSYDKEKDLFYGRCEHKDNIKDDFITKINEMSLNGKEIQNPFTQFLEICKKRK